MKILNSILQIILSLILFSLVVYFLTGYDSAFEADQSCHSLLSNYSSKMDNLECDHDLETHKWILFQNQNNSEPAKIIKKFRYKFL